MLVSDRNAVRAWTIVLREVRKKVPEEDFQQWILPLEPRFEQTGLCVIAPFGMFQRRVQRDYEQLINATARKVIPILVVNGGRPSQPPSGTWRREFNAKIEPKRRVPSIVRQEEEIVPQGPPELVTPILETAPVEVKAPEVLPPREAIPHKERKPVVPRSHQRGVRRRPEVAIDVIIDVVAIARGISRDEILSDSRLGRVTQARQEAGYLCRKFTVESYPTIGRAIGLDHSTVIRGKQAVEKRSKEDKEYAESIKALEAVLAKGG